MESSLTEYTARTQKAEREYTVLRVSIKGLVVSFQTDAESLREEKRREEKRKSDAEKMGHNISKNSKSVYTLVALVVPCKTPGVPWETPGYLGRCSGCHARSPGSHARHPGQCKVRPGSSKGQEAPWKGIGFLHGGWRALEWYTGQPAFS